MRNIFVLLASVAAVQIRVADDSLAETAQKVQIETINKGTGELCQTDQTATVHYTGSLKSNGHVFDSSVPRGEPFNFKIGDFRVIKCWEQAIVQLHVGDKVDITCPAETAYGQRDMGEIPANSDLKFNVEVLSCANE